jgi:hypothetical protein
MTEELPLLIDRIRSLLDHQGRDSDLVEHTLTDGYAGALALEGERERTRRRIRALAVEASSAEHARELRTLVAALDRTEAELAELRNLLGSLAARR